MESSAPETQGTDKTVEHDSAACLALAASSSSLPRSRVRPVCLHLPQDMAVLQRLRVRHVLFKPVTTLPHGHTRNRSSPPPVTPGMGSRSRRSRSSPSSCSRAGLSLCARASAAASVCSSTSCLPKPGFELCEAFRMAAEPSASCALWPSSSLQSIVMGCLGARTCPEVALILASGRHLPNSSGSSPQAPSCRSPGAMVASACLPSAQKLGGVKASCGPRLQGFEGGGLAPFLLGAMVTEVQLGSLSSNFRRVEFKDFRITCHEDHDHQDCC